MKTAISLPDELFDDAEGLAEQLNVSRSELYNGALREYLARHLPDMVTQSLNEVCQATGDEDADFIRKAAQRTLVRNE